MQRSADLKTLKTYLGSFDPSTVEKELCADLAVAPGGPLFPILYFAVERNSPAIVQLLCNAGAQPSQRTRPLGLAVIRLPILAYAILRAEYDISDTTDTLIALLAMGADPSDTPRDMWENYLKAPTKDMSKLGGAEVTKDMWCTPELREALCRNLNLMQRYALWKASGKECQAGMMREVASAHNITPLLETIYHIIGQRLATQRIIDRITDHIMYKDSTPLVLLFTGPSGHGKTELARRMGDLLSLEMHMVDCTKMKHETDLFGAKKPYEGWEEGAPLNNFLWKNAGERCVVFLDESEKTTEEVRNAMLKLFEHGIYKDRRFDKPVDCSQTIWVLAANLGCELIQQFWVHQLKEKTEEQQKKVSFTGFERSLKQNIINVLGAPFTGRLTEIVPFMPFNAGEQAVATYKFMQGLWTTVRKDIDTTSRLFPRHMYIKYNDDGAIAAHLARHNYSPETGARSLQRAVDREIRGRLSRVFLGGEEMVKDEMNNGPLQNYEVRMVTVEEDIDEVSVELRGTKKVQSLSETGGSLA